MISNKEITGITLNLVIIYLIGGLFLALIYVKTKPVISQNMISAQKLALTKIMPEADAIEKIGDWKPHEQNAEYYTAKKASVTCGYIVETYGKGYSGFIHMLIATDTLYRILRISVLSHSETPGLGDGIETKSFQNQFSGKTVDQMKVIKGPTTSNIQALSGATISSRAVTEDAVKNALAMLINVKGSNALSVSKESPSVDGSTAATPSVKNDKKSGKGDTAYGR